MKEEFRPIKGIENYEVSNLGRIRNVYTKRIRICNINKHGYPHVSIWSNNKNHSYEVHMLVAITFIPNPNNYPEVNHKDEDKTNNNVENLEWCSRKYNLNYGTHNERMGKNHCKPVLQYDLEGNFIKEWPSIMEIRRQLGYNDGNICCCCKGKYKQRYGYIWKYKYTN